MLKLASLVAFALVLAACTSAAEETTTTVAVTSSTTTLPQATTTTSPPDGFGGEAVVGIPFGLNTLNPFQAGGLDGARLVGNALWATVYDMDPDAWERIPDNVSALPSTANGGIEINDDGSMTVQYQVPRTATWSDGRPISGADLAFTAEAMRDLAFAGNLAVDPIMKTVVSTDSVEQVAWITFSGPNLAFEDALWIILPSHALEGVDLERDTDGSDWPSGGPFMVEDFVAGEPISLVRNPNYWKTTSNGAEMLKVATPVLEHLTFNFLEARDAANEISMNDEVTFRQAVPRSLDPAIFARPETVWTGSLPGVLTPLDGSAWATSAYDPTAASDAIIALENPLPTAVLTTTVNASLRTEIGMDMVKAFDSIGVDLETSFIDSVEFFGEVLGGGTYDIGMWAWVNDGGYGGVVNLMERLDPASTPDGFNGWGSGSAASEATIRYSELVVALSSLPAQRPTRLNSL
jgi:ABC-type transport system substrate-binding protein